MSTDPLYLFFLANRHNIFPENIVNSIKILKISYTAQAKIGERTEKKIKRMFRWVRSVANWMK